MFKKPESVKELYAFFMPNLIKPPGKPSYIFAGIHFDRPGWHIDIYGRPVDDAMIIWFYSHPNRDPNWTMSYDKFMHENATTCIHR